MVNDSDMALTCLLPPNTDDASRQGRVTDIVTRVVEGGDAWVSVAIFEGKPVVRVCITNGTTTEDDIDRLAAELIRVSEH